VAADFADLGEHGLKNIAKPVRAYALSPEAIAAVKVEPAERSASVGELSASGNRDASKPAAAKGRAALAPLVAGIAALVVVIAGGAWYFVAVNRPAAVASDAAAPAEAKHLSIVVLPFANLSGDPAQDYFADGITENLTTDLSRIRNSFVIAHNTAFTYKGKAIDAKEIGKELGVRYILEGSVQRDGPRVRVNAQLVDAESGAHLWADRFEEDLADLFKLQDHVVARLVNSLGDELVKAEAEKGARSKNPDAIDLTMRGTALLQREMLDLITVPMSQDSRRNMDKNDAARALFEQALKLDPNEADALAGEASTYENQFGWWRKKPDTDYEERILGQADRAIALAPDNVAVYEAKSKYLFNTHRLDAALRATDAGLAINPNSARLYAARGWPEVNLGRFEQAKSDMQQAMRLSPRDPDMGLWHLDLGSAELGLGHYEAAIEEFRKADNSGCCGDAPPISLVAAYALAGKVDEAKSALAEARRIDPKLTIKWLVEETHAPNLPPLFEGLRKAGLAEE
jgi:TolB-like protein/Flp pilus assembly protein TadD